MTHIVILCTSFISAVVSGQTQNQTQNTEAYGAYFNPNTTITDPESHHGEILWTDYLALILVIAAIIISLGLIATILVFSVCDKDIVKEKKSRPRHSSVPEAAMSYDSEERSGLLRKDSDHLSTKFATKKLRQKRQQELLSDKNLTEEEIHSREIELGFNEASPEDSPGDVITT